jgi:CBS-domain-containing membrane protein
LENIIVSELCEKISEKRMVRDDMGIEHAIKAFAFHSHTHVLFVVNKEGVLTGIVKLKQLLEWVKVKLNIVSEKHMVTRSDAFEVLRLSQSCTIKEITSGVVSVKQTDTIAHAINLMADKEMVEMPVIDEAGKLAGELRISDLLSKLLGDIASTESDNTCSLS